MIPVLRCTTMALAVLVQVPPMTCAWVGMCKPVKNYFPKKIGKTMILEPTIPIVQAG